jgi:hypothetical protein
VKKVIVGEKVNKQAQYRHTAAAGYIPERLDRDPFFADRMKKINDLQDGVLDEIELTAISIVFHRWAKVMKMAYFWTVRL